MNNYKTIYLTMLILAINWFSITDAHANNQNKAKAYYFAAEDAFEAKQYTDALTAIDKVESLLGKNNAALSALKVKIYFAQEDYTQAKKSLDTFFGFKSSKTLTREMSGYLLKIDEGIDAKKEAAKIAIVAEKNKLKKEQLMLDILKREALAPKMIGIPAGSFLMGANGHTSDEQPVHRVSIRAFNMSQTEVTFAKWDECVSEGGCSHNPDDEGWGRGSRPVINISYKNITQQFIPWLNKITGNTDNRRYRLPTEAEWEYVARGGSTTKYSWGNDISCSQARFGINDIYCNNNDKKTTPVKSFLANSFDIYDMHGNVWEWTQDCWNDNHIDKQTNGKARIGGDCSKHVMRGGSWYNDPYHLRSSYREKRWVSVQAYTVGFRLAQDIE